MRTPMNLNNEEYLALAGVVDYYLDDEQKNYQEEPTNKKEAKEYKQSHIFNDLLILSLKLKEYQMKETV